MNSSVRGNNGFGSGGIENNGQMSMRNSSVSGNTGTGARWGGTGGITNRGALTLTNVTINDNIGADQGDTIGGIENSGTLIIINSTVSGNSLQTLGGFAGGIYNTGVLSMTNATVSGNSGNGDWYDSLVGGIFNSGIITLNNTIVATNTMNGAVINCNGSVTSTGHNLSDDTSCAFTASGDISNTNARLAPLGNYGGATLTQAPLPNSPAIDAGDHATCPAFDQRGVPRPFDGNYDGNAVCDIGAVEFNLILTRTAWLPLIDR